VTAKKLGQGKEVEGNEKVTMTVRGVLWPWQGEPFWEVP